MFYIQNFVELVFEFGSAAAVRTHTAKSHEFWARSRIRDFSLNFS